MAKIVSTIVTFTVIFFIMATAIQITWNYVIPYLFELPRVNIWQAGALYILSNALFKSYEYKTGKK